MTSRCPASKEKCGRAVTLHTEFDGKLNTSLIFLPHICILLFIIMMILSQFSFSSWCWTDQRSQCVRGALCVWFSLYSSHPMCARLHNVFDKLISHQVRVVLIQTFILLETRPVCMYTGICMNTDFSSYFYSQNPLLWSLWSVVMTTVLTSAVAGGKIPVFLSLFSTWTQTTTGKTKTVLLHGNICCTFSYSDE